MADRFRLQMCRRNLKRNKGIGDRVTVTEDMQFVGFDNYKHVIDNCDVVILTTPPHFRPIHLAYAIEKGVHVFCEKPIATDGPGVRSVLATTEEAKKKNLAIVSGLCWRYYWPRVEAMNRIHNGFLGDVTAVETTLELAPSVDRPVRLLYL